MQKSNGKPRNQEMYEAILTLETVEECMRFFDDLCSITELKAMEQRYTVAKLLNDGQIYNAIMDETGTGTKAGAIVFPLPVTDTAGMRMMEDLEEEEA